MDIFMKILPYILNIISALILALATYLINKIRKDRKMECDSQRNIASGIQAMLRDRIIQKCEYHIQKGFCSSDDKTVLEKMFKPYTALGGNDVAKKIYEHAMELPEFKEE
jgi:hypothetical protein